MCKNFNICLYVWWLLLLSSEILLVTLALSSEWRFSLPLQVIARPCCRERKHCSTVRALPAKTWIVINPLSRDGISHTEDVSFRLWTKGWQQSRFLQRFFEMMPLLSPAERVFMSAYRWCLILSFDEQVTYIQVIPGFCSAHTVLLRSDGRAVACEKTVCASSVLFRSRILTERWPLRRWFDCEKATVCFVTLFSLWAWCYHSDLFVFGWAGELLRLKTSGLDIALENYQHLALRLNADRQQRSMVLPDGQL